MHLLEMYSADVKIADMIWLGQQLTDAGQQEIRVRVPGVPTAEFVVMRHLIDGPPSTITSLVDRTGYAQSRVSTAVASLVERGWAQTSVDPSDGRRTLVSAPHDIRRYADSALSAESGSLAGLLDGLPPVRRAAIYDALDDLLAVLRARTDGGSAAP
jgi:MarR family transcriptional regulator, 2-MHQ and catechol-resistance regulon repressor